MVGFRGDVDHHVPAGVDLNGMAPVPVFDIHLIAIKSGVQRVRQLEIRGQPPFARPEPLLECRI